MKEKIKNCKQKHYSFRLYVRELLLYIHKTFLTVTYLSAKLIFSNNFFNQNNDINCKTSIFVDHININTIIISQFGSPQTEKYRKKASIFQKQP